MCPGRLHLPKQFSAVSALLSSNSSSSLPVRHHSVGSTLSSSERMRLRRESSEVSLGSADQLSSERNVQLLSVKKTTFSPIHEHEELTYL